MCHTMDFRLGSEMKSLEGFEQRAMISLRFKRILVAAVRIMDFNRARDKERGQFENYLNHLGKVAWTRAQEVDEER